ncbi:hypothetical protein [Nostoc sp.]|uniref:hypothetical protein n=1 Tax=Nostoc sp. TaxID=1180 RepID=UPI002FF5E8D5
MPNGATAKCCISNHNGKLGFFAPLRYAQNDKIYRPKTFQTSSYTTDELKEQNPQDA